MGVKSQLGMTHISIFDHENRKAVFKTLSHKVGNIAKFVQVETELFTLMVIFYFRCLHRWNLLCSFGRSKCTCFSALAFTLAGPHWL